VGIGGRGQVADQILEELLAGALGRSFDSGAGRADVVVGHHLWRTAPVSARLSHRG
jgi:hypothetical protein